MRQSAPRASTSLFETPNLTPIPMNEKSFAVAAHVPASATNPQVVTRARKVAARLYYPPSPEMTTPGSVPSSSRPRSLFLGGLDGRRSFSSATGSVPEDSAFAETPGEVPGKKSRALFSAAKGKPPLNEPKLEESATTEDSGEATVRMKGGSGDGSDEEQGVQEILELLCVLGAAHKNLCQVRQVCFLFAICTFNAFVSPTLMSYSIAAAKHCKSFIVCHRCSFTRVGYSIKWDAPILK